jgi:hypothetical protein
MATKLYREGTTHCVNGIDCEVRLFTTGYPLRFVGTDGWCKTPEDINKDNKTDDDEWSGYTSDQIRELAKDAGIDGWDTKRIHTLKEVLNGQGT